MRRTTVLSILLVAAAALVVAAAAAANGGRGNDGGDKGKGQKRNAAVTVFELGLTPKQEVPRVNLRAHGVGALTLDVTRDSAGAITSGEAIFYVNYDFPGSVTITGLHVHQGQRGTNGPVVIDSGVPAFTDADGDGNVTAVVSGVSPTLLQSILAKPRDFYVNLHTSVNPTGALRDQLQHSNKRKRDD